MPFCKRKRTLFTQTCSLCVGDEGDDVAVGVGDVEVGSAPGLFRRGLGDRGAPAYEFFVQGLDVVSLDGGADEGFLPGGGQMEYRFMHEAQVQAGAVARNGPIKGRRAVEEVDLEAELFPEEFSARRDVANEEDRDRGPEGGRCGLSSVCVEDRHGRFAGVGPTYGKERHTWDRAGKRAEPFATPPKMRLFRGPCLNS